MNKKELHYALIIDKFLEDNIDPKTCTNPELKEAMEYFEEKAKRNMGIGMVSSCYIYLKDGQDGNKEYQKIQYLIKTYIAKLAQENNRQYEDYDLEFINYGQTELVYVLTDMVDGSKRTILAKQPVVEFGKIYQEAQNLIELNKKDPSVVAPIDYFAAADQELYVTPYIEQARCIGSDGKWGMYIPEPYYRFEHFTPVQSEIVTACMIAKLISYYDYKNNLGICSCKLGGGDFMLPKGWEEQEPTIENTLENLYFIAAREKVKCSLIEYLDTIRDEFSRATINEPKENLIINHRGRVPVEPEIIEAGIEIGLILLEQQMEEEDEK